MTPRATYRLQFRKEFTFKDASDVAPYLARLGVSHIYASPILAARAGSSHGYDVVDHARISDELGGEEGLRRLVETLKTHGMGLIVDIVPNHMATGWENAWWMDVLEHGRTSDYARCFDIDWAPPDPTLRNKVLLPVLGAPLAETLARGEIEAVRDEHTGKQALSYAGHRFPLRAQDGQIAPEDFRRPEALREWLERQHYRLAWWRTAGDLINWRRFFDINDLVALRMEDDDVFEAVHAKMLALYQQGLVDGFRVDHVDGLADPRAYCRKLRARLDALRPGGYLVVEKILASGERLPADWGVDGSTGYDFMNDVSAMLHDPAGAEPLVRAWTEISGRTSDFHVEEREARRELLLSKFHGAYEAVARSFSAVEPDVGRDMTDGAFRRALFRLLGELRSYRTYATGDRNSPAPGSFFEEAVVRALRRASANDAAAIEEIARAFRGLIGKEDEAHTAVRRFNQLAASLAAKAGEDTAFYRYGALLSRNEVGSDPDEFALEPHQFHARAQMRLQGSPMLATATHDHKRGEDARMRLAVLSEISAEWLANVSDWFELNAPLRDCRIARADEYQLYQTLVGAWPCEFDWRDAESLVRFRDRIRGWQLKSLHEAKLRTSWGDPDQAYEDACDDFVRRLLDPVQSAEFLARLSAFVDRIAPGAALNGLVQTGLRCTAPGVPDLYQGAEFWDLSLVDPDNRRPVDFAARRRALKREVDPSDLLRNWAGGELKQFVIAQLLALRRRNADCFLFGDYRPLNANGLRGRNVIAFLRSHGDVSIAVVAPRLCAAAAIEAQLPLPASDFWGETTVSLPHDLAGWNFESLFDPQVRIAGKQMRCADLFLRFPLAVLVSSL
jgi:(1->4)-alpha-D-glucan 1-alpha-D-glucosylmutase